LCAHLRARPHALEMREPWGRFHRTGSVSGQQAGQRTAAGPGGRPRARRL